MARFHHNNDDEFSAFCDHSIVECLEEECQVTVELLVAPSSTSLMKLCSTFSEKLLHHTTLIRLHRAQQRGVKGCFNKHSLQQLTLQQVHRMHNA
jgi:hypothetical protein